jgi:hypothetical protein
VNSPADDRQTTVGPTRRRSGRSTLMRPARWSTGGPSDAQAAPVGASAATSDRRGSRHAERPGADRDSSRPGRPDVLTARLARRRWSRDAGHHRLADPVRGRVQARTRPSTSGRSRRAAGPRAASVDHHRAADQRGNASSTAARGGLAGHRQLDRSPGWIPSTTPFGGRSRDRVVAGHEQRPAAADRRPAPPTSRCAARSSEEVDTALPTVDQPDLVRPGCGRDCRAQRIEVVGRRPAPSTRRNGAPTSCQATASRPVRWARAANESPDRGRCQQDQEDRRGTPDHAVWRPGTGTRSRQAQPARRGRGADGAGESRQPGCPARQCRTAAMNGSPARRRRCCPPPDASVRRAGTPDGQGDDGPSMTSRRGLDRRFSPPRSRPTAEIPRAVPAIVATNRTIVSAATTSGIAKLADPRRSGVQHGQRHGVSAGRINRRPSDRRPEHLARRCRAIRRGRADRRPPEPRRTISASAAPAIIAGPITGGEDRLGRLPAACWASMVGAARSRDGSVGAPALAAATGNTLEPAQVHPQVADMTRCKTDGSTW